jgi:lipoprotein-anchoring transpeptidase ErfK/SrfK
MRRLNLTLAVVAAALLGAIAPAAAVQMDMIDLSANAPIAPQTLGNSTVQPRQSAVPRETVSYNGPYGPGTILVSTGERRMYFVLPGGQAIKYGVGVGRPGFEWSGAKTITRKAEWPGWTPPAQMLRRRPDLPRHMPGGIDNPLGARAMYLGSSLYRIHGSNEPGTIGQAVSSGCIRMTNEDVTDLYERAKVGTKVVVIR